MRVFSDDLLLLLLQLQCSRYMQLVHASFLRLHSTYRHMRQLRAVPVYIFYAFPHSSLRADHQIEAGTVLVAFRAGTVSGHLSRDENESCSKQSDKRTSGTRRLLLSLMSTVEQPGVLSSRSARRRLSRSVSSGCSTMKISSSPSVYAMYRLLSAHMPLHGLRLCHINTKHISRNLRILTRSSATAEITYVSDHYAVQGHSRLYRC